MTSYTERCVYDRGWGWWSYPRPTGSGWHALICHAGLTHIIHWGVFVEEFLSSAWKTVKAHMLNEHKLRCKYSQTWHLHGYEVAQVVPSQEAFKFNMVGNINLTCALHSSVMPYTVSFTHIHGVKKKRSWHRSVMTRNYKILQFQILSVCIYLIFCWPEEINEGLVIKDPRDCVYPCAFSGFACMFEAVKTQHEKQVVSF